jgi:hypothetical protein
MAWLAALVVLVGGTAYAAREVWSLAIARDADSNLGRHLGRHPSLPLPRLVERSRHADTWVRQAVADNVSIDAAIAMRLAADGDEEVRLRLAGNRGAPRDVLEKLAADPAGRVAQRARSELARRR